MTGHLSVSLPQRLYPRRRGDELFDVLHFAISAAQSFPLIWVAQRVAMLTSATQCTDTDRDIVCPVLSRIVIKACQFNTREGPEHSLLIDAISPSIEAISLGSPWRSNRCLNEISIASQSSRMLLRCFRYTGSLHAYSIPLSFIWLLVTLGEFRCTLS